MPDPFWIDSDVINAIAKGDTALEGEVRAMSGQCLIPPLVWEQLTVGNPFPKKIGKPPVLDMHPETLLANKAALNRLGAIKDLSGVSMDDRMGSHVETLIPNKIIFPQQKGNIPHFKHQPDYLILSEVLSAAKARNVKNPRLLSLDNDMRNSHAPNLHEAMKNTDNPNPPKVVVISRNSTPYKASVGEASKSPAISGATDSNLIGLVNAAHFIIKNGLTKVSQEKAMNEALEEYKKNEMEIAKQLHNAPGESMRVTFFFTFQPGVNRDFNDNWIFDGLDFRFASNSRPAIIAEQVPRGEPRNVTITIPPDPSAKAQIRLASASNDFKSIKEAAPHLSHNDPWDVTIGEWRGLFDFDPYGQVTWAHTKNDLYKGLGHKGTWTVVEGRVEFEFFDDPPENKRRFVLKNLGILRNVQGYIKPEGVGGFFEMKLPILHRQL